MKNSEEAIEKVLTALRDSKVPAGLEQRIREATQLRASSQPASHWQRWSRLWFPAPFRPDSTHAVAWRTILAGAVMSLVACVIAISVTLAALHRHEHRTMQSKLSPAPKASTRATAPAAGAQDAHLRLHAPGNQIAPTRAKIHARKPRPIIVAYSSSLRKSWAVDHPAPDAPLTQEEKLLLQIAHSGNPHELAMLNPVLRAKQEAEDEAEFHKFIEQSDKGDNE